jgi:prolyl-tRNA editing enzyme YbaK/EbsC (Cys-tRNA(Pro) deacylase)
LSECERTVEDVQQVLRAHNIQVEELPADTSTAAAAAAALGTSVGSIVKSLLFLADDEPVLVLVAGDRKLNRARLAVELGARQVRLARPEEVIEVTGYRIGGVPPVAHRRPINTLVDRNLLAPATVYAAAGASNAIFPIAASELLDLTGGQITDATE